MDSDGKHYRRMRSALWLFSYFVIHANRVDGSLRRKYETIARDMGLSESTVRRWMSTLKSHGYIEVVQTGHAQLIHIRQWKSANSSKIPLKTEHSARSLSGTRSVQFRTRTASIGKPFPA